MTLQSVAQWFAARRRWWRWALLVVGAVAAVVALRGALPGPQAILTAVRQASPAWLLAAAVAQVASMAAFAEQQRRLLRAFGVRLPMGTSLALSYARSAIATALPAGSAVSAGYAFRQFRARGADQSVAAAVMVLSGVASVIGLVLLALASSYWVAVGVALMVVLACVRRRATRTTVEKEEPPVSTGFTARIRRELRRTLRMATAVSGRDWTALVALAVANWLMDLVCLIAALHAVGLSVPTGDVVAAFLAVQLVRQIPLTPGGIGVIEASLVVALTAAGAAATPAAAAVLVYRLLSCWLVVPVGLMCWTALRTVGRPGRPLIQLLSAPATAS